MAIRRPLQLPNEARGYSYLRDVQGEVLKAWDEQRTQTRMWSSK